MEAIVASGLGGGSLIYANVLLRKPERWFMTPLRTGGFRPWPITRADLDPHYDAVEKMMGVQCYPAEDLPFSQTPKMREFSSAAEQLRLTVQRPPLAVTFKAPGADKPFPGQVFDVEMKNLHRTARTTCRLCGECDIGCNDGSKNSLDFTYLSAAEAKGAEIRVRCEARTISPCSSGGYEVTYIERPIDAAGAPLPARSHTVAADRVILAAGTLGSTFLLLANQTRLPGLSTRLGHGFCGNGDMLSFATRARGPRGNPRLLFPSRGPVITTTLHTDLEDPRDAFFLQDAGFPNFASWLVDSLDSSSNLRRIGKAARRFIRDRLTRMPPGQIGSRLAGLLPDEGGSAATMPLLAMGMDMPEGRMGLTYVNGRPRLTLTWPKRGSADYFRLLRRTSRRIAHVMGADYSPNPLQHLLGQLVTVHPLGGCAIGRDPNEGVVDEHCQVFGHPGLFVVDGSVMPGPVGPNPSLTIAAIADRAATHLLD